MLKLLQERFEQHIADGRLPMPTEEYALSMEQIAHDYQVDEYLLTYDEWPDLDASTWYYSSLACALRKASSEHIFKTCNFKGSAFYWHHTCLSSNGVWDLLGGPLLRVAEKTIRIIIEHEDLKVEKVRFRYVGPLENSEDVMGGALRGVPNEILLNPDTTVATACRMIGTRHQLTEGHLQMLTQVGKPPLPGRKLLSDTDAVLPDVVLVLVKTSEESADRDIIATILMLGVHVGMEELITYVDDALECIPPHIAAYRVHLATHKPIRLMDISYPDRTARNNILTYLRSVSNGKIVPPKELLLWDLASCAHALARYDVDPSLCATQVPHRAFERLLHIHSECHHFQYAAIPHMPCAHNNSKCLPSEGDSWWT